MENIIYLLRHGEAASCGPADNDQRTDPPLSSWGVTETNLLRKWYDNGHSYPIYTSPARCCRQSAEIIGGYKEKKSLISFVKDNTLKPVFTLEELAGERMDACGTNRPKASGTRLANTITRVASSAEEPCLIISHADRIHAFLSGAFHIPQQPPARHPYPHLGITKLCFDGTALRLANPDAVGERPIEMLRQEEIAHFYHVLNTPPEHISHMQAVSLYIDNLLTMLSIDPESHDAELVRAASLTYLADPGDFAMHHSRSAHFLKMNGYSAVARIIETSDTSTAAQKDEATVTLSELLCYADDCILHGQLVSLEERFSQKAPEKYEKLKSIQEKIFARI